MYNKIEKIFESIKFLICLFVEFIKVLVLGAVGLYFVLKILSADGIKNLYQKIRYGL